MAKIIEELRRKEIWFNICKSMPRKQPDVTDYKYMENDYFNKRFLNTNWEVNADLKNIVKHDQ